GGDVTGHAAVAGEPAFIVEQWRGLDVNAGLGRVGANERRFELVRLARVAPGEVFLPGGVDENAAAVDGAAAGRDQFGHGDAAEHRAVRRGEGEVHRRVDFPVEIRGDIREIAKSLPAQPQFVLGRLLAGDVEKHAAQAADGALAGGDRELDGQQ